MKTPLLLLEDLDRGFRLTGFGIRLGFDSFRAERIRAALTTTSACQVVTLLRPTVITTSTVIVESVSSSIPDGNRAELHAARGTIAISLNLQMNSRSKGSPTPRRILTLLTTVALVISHISRTPPQNFLSISDRYRGLHHAEEGISCVTKASCQMKPSRCAMSKCFVRVEPLVPPIYSIVDEPRLLSYICDTQ